MVKKKGYLWRGGLLLGLGSGSFAPLGAADEAAFKLTTGVYAFSSGAHAMDVNVRHTGSYGNGWLGYFHTQQEEGFRQWRAGWDKTFGEGWRITPSLQVASRGFVGGSVQGEWGGPWFVGAGLGRTNLKPYWNLNFDPNDAYNVMVGYRHPESHVGYVQYIRDNREHPDQRHMHAYWRQSLSASQRVTLDLLYKVGLVEDEMIHRVGFSATYDWPSVFARLAYDPQANFEPENLWRMALGKRF